MTITRDSLIDIVRTSAKASGFDPDNIAVRGFRNNVAGAVLGEFEWERGMRAALEDVAEVAREMLSLVNTSDATLTVGRDRFAQLRRALLEVDRLRKIEARDEEERSVG